MSDQQLNPNPQSPLSPQLSQSPQNKLWPINWGHNRALKIFGTILVIALAIITISGVFLYVYNNSYNVDCVDCVAPFNFILNVLRWVFVFFVLVLFFAALATFFISLIKIKKLDKVDKIFSILSLLIILMGIAVYIYLRVRFGPPPELL